jgi:hypothetical protein
MAAECIFNAVILTMPNNPAKSRAEARDVDESNIRVQRFLRARLGFTARRPCSLFGILRQMRATMADRQLYNYLHTVELCRVSLFLACQKDKLAQKLLKQTLQRCITGFPLWGFSIF